MKGPGQHAESEGRILLRVGNSRNFKGSRHSLSDLTQLPPLWVDSILLSTSPLRLLMRMRTGPQD